MEILPWLFLLLLLAAGFTYLLLRREVVVYQYERGLLFRNGRLLRVVEPGRLVIYPRWEMLVKLDMRAQVVSLPGQEVLSADNISLRISLGGSYRIQDPAKAILTSASYPQALYLALQLLLRELTATEPVDSLLEKRNELGRLLLEGGKPQAEILGLELPTLDIKDIMFPGDLKRVFAQVVNARKEGQAALERARGESAALRNLLNAARLMQENPALLQLRALQAVGGTSGNTLIVHFDSTGAEIVPVGKGAGAADKPDALAADE